MPSTTVHPAKSKGGSSQRSDGDGRAKILEAALERFSSQGFDGTSLRDVANTAGVMHQLVVYHFKTKEGLWRETIDDLMRRAYPDGIGRYVESAAHATSGEDAAHALKGFWRDFAWFTARNPQLHRILTFDGRAETTRFDWLLETYVRPLYGLGLELMERAQAEGRMRAGEPGRLFYACIGLVTVTFVFDRQYNAMTTLQPFSDTDVEAVIGLAYDFLGV